MLTDFIDCDNSNRCIEKKTNCPKLGLESNFGPKFRPKMQILALFNDQSDFFADYFFIWLSASIARIRGVRALLKSSIMTKILSKSPNLGPNLAQKNSNFIIIHEQHNI